MRLPKAYRRPRGSHFPHPTEASPDGIVAVGAEPFPELLLDAYSHGIFPWPHDDLPLLWFSPDPRFVLDPRRAHVGRSLLKTMKRTSFRLACDTAFSDVMDGCRKAARPGQRGTWITDAMKTGYMTLHAMGLAHSVEVFDDDTLVGGFYGVSLGRAFFGESMFARAPDASKVAFATFLAHAIKWDLAFVDCQAATEHLARFGATDWPRDDFLAALDTALDGETRQGKWHLEFDAATAAQFLKDVLPNVDGKVTASE